MKKTILTFSLLILRIFYSNAQDFAPGYYIINSSAEYAVAIPSGIDYYTDENGCAQQYEIESLRMNEGEVVIAYELSKNKYYCFDPNGRMVVFQGANCLTKAPNNEGSGVGKMEATISLIDGSSLEEGSYYWIIGQNTANSTFKIQVANGKTYDVPEDKITLYVVLIKNIMKNQFYKSVDE
jgi:hypothetical protein